MLACDFGVHRYLDAKVSERAAADSRAAGVRSTATAKLQPASLAGNVLYTSPLSARSLSLSGRGRLADKGTVYTTKVGGTTTLQPQ